MSLSIGLILQNPYQDTNGVMIKVYKLMEVLPLDKVALTKKPHWQAVGAANQCGWKSYVIYHNLIEVNYNMAFSSLSINIIHKIIKVFWIFLTWRKESVQIEKKRKFNIPVESKLS